MLDQKKAQDQSLEIKQYKNISEYSSLTYPKTKSNQNKDNS